MRYDVRRDKEGGGAIVATSVANQWKPSQSTGVQKVMECEVGGHGFERWCGQ
jgi:hypothetical protein